MRMGVNRTVPSKESCHVVQVTGDCACFDRFEMKGGYRKMGCVHGRLEICGSLGLVFKQPIIGLFHMKTEEEVKQSTISNCPSNFGSGGFACHCAVDSMLDIRQDNSFG